MHRGENTEDDLMEAVVDGDEAAFDTLVRRHRNWVCRLLYAFTHNQDQAEDMTQEVFCRVHRHARQYTAQGQFLAWLKRIAVNVGKDFLVQKERANLIPLDDCQDMPEEDGSTDPLALLMAQEIREEMREAIFSLPDDQRLTIVMRYFGAMSVQEIAWAMKCPEGTIKSRLFYGLRRIRELVAPRSDSERIPNDR